jgi:uroporphyrinogen decarboxylase
MTHRERLLKALSHEETDKVPIDLGGTSNSSIVVEAYEELKAHFGIQSDNVPLNLMMRVVHVDEEILKKLDIDVRNVTLWFPRNAPGDSLDSHRYRDMWGVERIRPAGGYYFDVVQPPLSGEITVAELTRYSWPDPDSVVEVGQLRSEIQALRKTTDCAIVLYVPPPFVHISQFLRGFEDWYVDFALNTSILEALADAVLDVSLAITKRVLTGVGDDVDVVLCADDLGAQYGLQISPDDYRKFIKPRHAAYFQLIHDLSPAKLLFHSCGSVASIIEDFIEIGVDVLNPVQVSTSGMNPANLKARFEGQMAFWGGIDSQHLLPRGSVEEVKLAVEKTIEVMGRGGGYVLSAVHNIQPDVPTENILAMFEHAREYVPSFLKG